MSPAPAGVRWRWLELTALDGTDLAAWRDLCAGAAEPNPFAEPALVLPSASLPGGGRTGLLVVEAGHRWLGCHPLRWAPRWRRFPGPVLDSWRHEMSFLGTPLVRAGHETAVAGALVEAWTTASPPWMPGPRAIGQPWLTAVEWVGTSGPLGTALLDRLGCRPDSPPGPTGALVYQAHRRAVLDRRANPAVADAVAGRHAREFRRLTRALERRWGAVRLTERAADPAGVDRFLALEGAGWKGRAGSAVAASAARAACFRAAVAVWAGDGRFSLVALEAGGRTLAMRCGVRAGDTLFLLKTAYDEATADVQPGAVLEWLALEEFLNGDGPRRIDGCSDPGNALINRLLPGRTGIGTILVPVPGRPGRTVIRLAARRQAPPAPVEVPT